MFANPNYKIEASPTKFSIITEKNIKPNNVQAQNHFSQEKFFVKVALAFWPIKSLTFDEAPSEPSTT